MYIHHQQKYCCYSANITIIIPFNQNPKISNQYPQWSAPTKIYTQHTNTQRDSDTVFLLMHPEYSGGILSILLMMMVVPWIFFRFFDAAYLMMMILLCDVCVMPWCQTKKKYCWFFFLQWKDIICSTTTLISIIIKHWRILVCHHRCFSFFGQFSFIVCCVLNGHYHHQQRRHYHRHHQQISQKKNLSINQLNWFNFCFGWSSFIVPSFVVIVDILNVIFFIFKISSPSFQFRKKRRKFLF